MLGWILDSIIVGVPLTIILSLLGLGDASGGEGSFSVQLGSAGSLLESVLFGGYMVYMWSRRGATIGQGIVGVRVVKTDGSALTIGNGVLRYIGIIISAMAFLIGLIWVAFHKQKQGWMDLIAGTYVIKKR